MTDESETEIAAPEEDREDLQDPSHLPDDGTTGYDAYGHTRVGIGKSQGDIAKLIRYNEGRHPSDGKHSTREAARDKKRVTQAFCSTLEVTPYQQREAVAAIGRLNLDRFGSQKKLEKVSLGTIKVVVERDRFHRFRESPYLSEIRPERLPKRMIDDDHFLELLEQHGVSRKDLYSVSQLVKRELKKRNYFGRSDTGEATINDVDSAAEPDSE